MKYFTIDWYNDMQSRGASTAFMEKTGKLGGEYNAYYNSVKNELPHSIIKLFEDSWHDAEVISFQLLSKEGARMILDCTGSFYSKHVKEI